MRLITNSTSRIPLFACNFHISTSLVNKCRYDAYVDHQQKLNVRLCLLLMDFFDDLPAEIPWLEISIFVFSIAFVSTIFKSVVLKDDDDQAVNFKVPIPKQCSPEWEGDVLEQPSIKVACLRAREHSRGKP